jgi:guanylate cyclase
MDKTLHIKGQMIFVPEWDQMLFLACPIMKDLNNLIWTGLFVNDLSMHDYSR